MDKTDLAALTADIVAAHVSHNHVPIHGVAALIESVGEALAALDGSPPAEGEDGSPEPKVQPRASIRADYLVCLECGQRNKVLTRHLAAAHGLTPKDYRARYELRKDYPMSAPNYTAARREMALAIGLGRKGRQAPAPAAGRPKGGTRGKGGQASKKAAGA